MKKNPRSFRSLIDEVLAESSSNEETLEDENLSPEPFSLSDEEDVYILMHRNIHFGGNFNVMLEYYEQEGVGVDPDISFPRIFALSEMERIQREDLAPLILSEPEEGFVKRAQAVYEKLREACHSEAPEQKHARLIAELILTEEEEPEAEIQAIVDEGQHIATPLLELLEVLDFANPLFPGYGRAHSYAVQCLGQMRSPEAVPQLFEMLNRSDFDLTEEILTAFRVIGVSAKRFLLKIIRGEQVTRDHETAAFALLHFAEDPQVATACLQALEKLRVRKDSEYAKYLVLGCEKLSDPDQQVLFRSICESPETGDELREEMQAIIAQW